MSQSQSARGSSKSKRSSKDREKKKSVDANFNTNCNANVKDISSPTKKYAGLSAENIKNLAEHIIPPNVLLSDEVCNVLAEDLNYKLRYMIHEASNRAIISNRTAINSGDIDETLNDLRLNKIYGAQTDPFWIQLGDQNCLYLDDTTVNLLEEAERELTFSQPLEPIITKNWLPDPKDLTIPKENYFKIMCEAVTNEDSEIRKMALQNLSSNPNIAQIIEYFYNFVINLLSKNELCEPLTSYALDLIEFLEMSPFGSTEVSSTQLKLLVKLILQKIFKPSANNLRNMSWVLSILCQRYPLREYVIQKLTQKLPGLTVDASLPLIMIINALGVDAIVNIFVENIDYFLDFLMKKWDSPYGYHIMETYFILYKNDVIEMSLYNEYPDLQDFMIMLYKPLLHKTIGENKESGVIKKQLFKTLRRIHPKNNKVRESIPYEDVFEIMEYGYKIREKLSCHKISPSSDNSSGNVIVIGKNSFHKSVFKNEKLRFSKCCDHSLFCYNL